MTEHPNRQPKGVPTGGQFAPSAHAESTLTLADARQAADQAVTAHETAYRQARDHAHRMTVAEWVADADLPPGSVISLVSWPEEPNGDGTYDIDLGTVFDPLGDDIDDLAGQGGAIPAGYCDGGTALDVFTVDGRSDRISVDKVRAWVAERGLAVDGISVACSDGTTRVVQAADVAAVRAVVADRGLAAEDLDDLVHDCCAVTGENRANTTDDPAEQEAIHEEASRVGSAVNNGGVDAQVTFLVAELGRTDAERQIRGLAPSTTEEPR